MHPGEEGKRYPKINFLLAKFFLKLYYTNQEDKMKAKTQRKKAVLNKRTIANLNGKQMKNVPGGQDETTVPKSVNQSDCCITKCTCTPTGVPGCPNCVSV